MRDVLSITKALRDESRLRALIAVRDGELCLCQIIQVLGLSPSTVSRHMHVLQQSGLVERTRRGKRRFFRLPVGAKSDAAQRALEWVLDELRNDSRLGEDARRIRVVRGQDMAELTACYRDGKCCAVPRGLETQAECGRPAVAARRARVQAPQGAPPRVPLVVCTDRSTWLTLRASTK